MSKKTVITSALIYTNNIPHLGNIIGSVLSADVYSRYLKSYYPREKTLFVGGVDEYGTATEVKARELNISCKELCDTNGILHKCIYDWLLIKFDCYGRTSQPNGDPSKPQLDWPQTKITHEIFKNLCKNGYVIERNELVMYCPELNTFVADRFVIAICPKCGSDKANSDQCDACGNLLTPDIVINPKYKLNPKLKLEVRTTTNLFIDTDKIWKDNNMTEWVQSRKSSWTKVANSITEDWLNMGLLPRSITRDLKWGTIVPDTPLFDSKYSNKVFYVWFDAPIGYISITESCLGTTESESYWKDPETKFVQFMAKDNVPFHSVIFPVTLRGSKYSNFENLDLVATNYLLYEGNKFSKTSGIGLFCDDMIKISEKYNLLPDYWRAYLIYVRPEKSDSNFVLNDSGGFVDFINNILIKNLGNLIHRILSIAFQIKNKHNIESFDIDIKSQEIKYARDDQKALITEYVTNMESYRFSDALKTCLKLSSNLNVYINEVEPWNLIKDDSKTDKLYKSIETIYSRVNDLAIMLEPFMPFTGNKIKNDFKIIFTSNTKTSLISTVYLPREKPTILFRQVPLIIYELKPSAELKPLDKLKSAKNNIHL